MENEREIIREAVEEKVMEFEISRAKGNKGDGHWYYLRAWSTGDEKVIDITSGIEASECYPESEYYGKGDRPPVTFHTVKEHYSPTASDGGLEWVEGSWDDKEIEYLAKKVKSEYGDWYDFDPDYLIPSTYTWEECAREAKIEIPENATGEQIKTIFKNAGWVPFTLGDPVEPIDISEIVNDAVDEICEKWNIE